MGNIFNMDNGFFTTLGKIVDIVIVSVVWLLLCIPLVTIGPATTALYYTIVKVIRRERGYVMREFFSSFKSNFKVGAISGIFIILASLMLLFDRSFAKTMEGNFGIALFSIFNALIFILISVTIYVFPLLSRFKISVLQLFKTSLFMAMKHLPTTILLVLVTAVFALGTYILPIAVLITPGLCLLLWSLLMERIFKKYMPEKSEEAEASGIDEWYLE